MTKTNIGVIGSGAMGSGIAQVAATAGHTVYLFDNNPEALQKAVRSLSSSLDKLVEKNKISQEQAEQVRSRTIHTSDLKEFASCGMVIEAIIENLDVKRSVFTELEKIVSGDCILASNTSSLSIASIAAAVQDKGRVAGIHFFNPAPVMPLVEIIPAITTDAITISRSKAIIDSWGKTSVIAKDTPGFIVNRVARSFYSESIRIYEEGIADFATIDWALKTVGGFRMGPFELMDFIGNDINYKVTESVWEQFFYEPRFKPSLTQKRLFEAGLYGRKTGRGYYDYSGNSATPAPTENDELAKTIFYRVISMLINEAIDSVYLGLASPQDIDLAMTKGVNYPKGLLRWADEIGLQIILNILANLYEEYGEDRYRPCILLKHMAKEGRTFY